MLHLDLAGASAPPPKRRNSDVLEQRGINLWHQIQVPQKIIEVHFPVPQMHQESFSLQNVSRQQITNQRESEISSKRKIIEQQRMKPVSD